MKTRLQSFQNKLEKQLQKEFKTYAELHQYSVNNLSEFWQFLAEFFEINFFDKPQRALEIGSHLIDTQWFTGATLSYTYEVFKHFRPNGIAIHYSDEEGNSLSVSWPSSDSSLSTSTRFLSRLIFSVSKYTPQYSPLSTSSQNLTLGA